MSNIAMMLVISPHRQIIGRYDVYNAYHELVLFKLAINNDMIQVANAILTDNFMQNEYPNALLFVCQKGLDDMAHRIIISKQRMFDLL